MRRYLAWHRLIPRRSIGLAVAVALSFLTAQAVAQQHAMPASGTAGAATQTAASGSLPTHSHAPRSFTLRTGIAEGRMVYLGVGGDIDGKVNPTLCRSEFIAGSK